MTDAQGREPRAADEASRRLRTRAHRPRLRTIPTTPREFRRKAEIHGSARELLTWGGVFFGYVPILAAARARAVLKGGPRVIVVTGTQGKTTATRLLRHVVGRPVDAWSEFNNNVRGEIGLTMLREPRGPEWLPLELGDGTGLMDRYMRIIRPEAALVLNVGAEHLGGRRDLAWAAEEMAPAVLRLPANGVAVLNADDARLSDLVRRARCRVVTFGHATDADVRIAAWGRQPDGRLEVDLVRGGERHPVSTQLIGAYYAGTVAGVVASAVAIGIPMALACQRVSEVPLTPSRMEPLVSTKGATVLSDDYKSTPETVVAGLAECLAWPAARRWAVLTDLTNLSGSVSQCHEQVASAARGFDVVVTTGELWAIHERVWTGHPAHVIHVASQMEAAAIVGRGHRADDLVFVKGSATHRARRISLALTGVEVGCVRPACERAMVRCEDCRLLRG